MSLGVAIHNSYEFTCEICTKLRSVLLTGLVAMVAFSEAAGRARAQIHLHKWVTMKKQNH